jgi:hypothetical protein
MEQLDEYQKVRSLESGRAKTISGAYAMQTRGRITIARW